VFSQWQFDVAPSVKANPSYEDFTTYTEESDPDTRINTTATHIDAILRRDEDTYLYKDKGADHFGSSWEHLVDATFVSADSSGSCAIPWAVSNYIDDMQYWRDNAKSHYCLFFYRSVNTYRLYLQEKHNGDAHTVDYSTGSLSLGTPYYLTINKSSTTLTCKIYTDSDRTSLYDTLLRTVDDDAFQYIFGCSSQNTGNAYIAEVDVDNLDLQEAPPSENSVTLNSPTETETSLTVNFNFTPTFYQSIVNASVYTNETGSWLLEETNSSAITNATSNVISHTLPLSAEGAVLWNVGVWNSTHGVFATSNSTFTLDIPPKYQYIDSNATSIAEEGTILLYGQGYDGIALDWAWLATNETTGGVWKNYTDVESRTTEKDTTNNPLYEDACDGSGFQWVMIAIPTTYVD